MSRLSSAFGDSYQKASAHLRTKTFELGGHIFKVRIPLTKEMEQLQERITKIDKQEAQKRFEKMTANFRSGENIEGVIVSDEDVVIDGRSTKDLIDTILMMECRMVEYIKLLIPEDGSLDDITYEEIDSEWPMQVQLELLAKISEAIQPGYKDARKN